jgi:HK97 gp10 family phage protein
MTLHSRLSQIAIELPSAVDAAVHAGAMLVQAEAKDRCPVGATGDLKQSIHIEQGDVPGEVYVVAGNRKVFYGRFVEHGHRQAGGSNVPPHPFLLPSLESQRETIVGLVGRAIGRVAR